jgi:glycosyltransferase involved in cell wall biosynthesis
MNAMRILLVTPADPYAGASGAEQRSALLLRALGAHGEVDAVQLTAGRTLEVTTESVQGRRLVKATTPAHPLPWRRFQPNVELTRRLEQALGQPLSGYRLVVGRYMWPSCQLALPAGSASIVDLDDWRYRYAPQAPWSQTAVKERIGKVLAHALAARQLRRFSAAWAASGRDLREIEREVQAALLPNIVKQMPDQVTPVPTGGTALVVGSMWYRPNAEGVQWLLSKVWPAVRLQQPQARLLIVGAVGKLVRDVWERVPGVQAPGFVEDLDQAYAQASVVVAPIFSGGGTNIKVLEAMAHGRPCLTTHFVCDGLAGLAAEGRHLLAADHPQKFASLLASALADPPALQPLADRARTQALAACNWQTFQTAVTDLVERTVARRA